MRRRTLVIVIAILAASTVIVEIVYLHSRPKWQLSASNANGGATVMVSTTSDAGSVYTVHIKGLRIQQPFHELTPRQAEVAPVPGVHTLFCDETLAPGRWTLQLEQVKLDIMPARLVVNDKYECGPKESLEITADQQEHNR